MCMYVSLYACTFNLFVCNYCLFVCHFCLFVCMYFFLFYGSIFCSFENMLFLMVVLFGVMHVLLVCK